MPRPSGSDALQLYEAVIELECIVDVLHVGWGVRLSRTLASPRAACTVADAASRGGCEQEDFSHTGSTLQPLPEAPNHLARSLDPSGPTAASWPLPLSSSPRRATMVLQSLLDRFPSDVAAIGVLGGFNSDKTLLLHQLCRTSPPTSEQMVTSGVSLRRATISSTPVTLLESHNLLSLSPFNAAQCERQTIVPSRSALMRPRTRTM